MNVLKEPYFGTEARAKVKNGIDKAVEAVKPTLGAVGQTAIIDLGGDFFPIEADDGITVLKNLQFKDRFEQTGLSMVKKRVAMVAEEGGDCTATTSTLTQAITNEAFSVWQGKKENTRKVVERLENGLESVIERLRAHSIPVEEKDIERIATVASLDSEIGKIVAEAYLKVGKEGIITVENSPIIGYSSEVVNGARFNQGFISPYFINQPETLSCVLENPAILVVNRRIAANSQLKIVEQLIKAGHTNILIIADDVQGEALASLVMNHQKRIINVCAVKPYYEADRKNDWMNDIATLTGAKVISEETGVVMENIDLAWVGKAEKVIVTRKHTTIVNGQGNPEEISKRADVVRGLIKEEVRERNRQILEERLGTLVGGVGVIRVGALTDTEIQSLKYKVQNAVNVVKGGLEEGIIIGGGACLAKIATEVDEEIFKNSITAPLKVQAENAGMFDDVVTKVKESGKHQGYNFLSQEFTDLIEDGVIDSAKNTRLALEAAVSVAKSLVRGEVVITEETYEEGK